MLIHVGFEIAFDYLAPTAALAHMLLHPSRLRDVRGAESFSIDSGAGFREFGDLYGNRCLRVQVPAGRVTFRHDALVADCGLPDPQWPAALQNPVEALPDETVPYLLASRYCDTDGFLQEAAKDLFYRTPLGWPRVQAVCDFVNARIAFDYMQARANRTASEAFRERTGVCRDYTHLAIAFCRILNIPARYCTGYLGDIGVPYKPPMDFSAWFEVYLGSSWHAFDARNNIPRIGRILMGIGRDAADVALTTSFGANTLAHFDVWTDEVSEAA